MLKTFSVTNYRRFPDTATLSLAVVGAEEQLHRSAIVYGANASGKTVLLAALYTMHLAFKNSVM